MGAVDADAHVIETVQTWSYLESHDRRYTPQLMSQSFGAELLSNEGAAVRDFWVIEGRAHGKDRNAGTDTSREFREMLSVEASRAHGTGWASRSRSDDLPYVLAHAGEDHLMIGTDYSITIPPRSSMPCTFCATINESTPAS